MMQTTVDGIVLAAGRSSRMGEHKALLQAGGETFLERAVDLLFDAGCRAVVAVLAADDEDGAAHALAASAIVARNPDSGSEQIASVRAGILAVGDADAVVVLPVDFPLIRQGTIAAVVHAWRLSRPPIVLPEYEGETGHPIVIARSLFAEILTADLPEGLHSLIRTHADDLVPVRVPDPGIHIDIDTPEDYARHFPPAAGESLT